LLALPNLTALKGGVLDPTANKIGTVFYTDEYFIVQIDSVFYSHISRGYKNLREYHEGKLEKPESWSIFKPGYSN
jgi:hypothetical protein